MLREARHMTAKGGNRPMTQEEAADKGRYHFVDRWSPESGAVRTLGMSLLQMGGVRLPEE